MRSENLIGAAEFDRLIQNQERHYQTYYEFQQQSRPIKTAIRQVT